MKHVLTQVMMLLDMVLLGGDFQSYSGEEIYRQMIA
jgi:hypothetical protein